MCSSEHIKFFCLQVIEHYLKTNYATASPADQQLLRSFLVSYLRKQVSVKSGVVKPYLDNKLSQVFALALVVDYPSRWPSYFRDLLGMLAQDERSVHVYLAILMAIDSEVVDRDIAHTPQVRTYDMITLGFNRMAIDILRLYGYSVVRRRSRETRS